MVVVLQDKQALGRVRPEISIKYRPSSKIALAARLISHNYQILVVDAEGATPSASKRTRNKFTLTTTTVENTKQQGQRRHQSSRSGGAQSEKWED